LWVEQKPYHLEKTQLSSPACLEWKTLSYRAIESEQEKLT
jgi:hypothetical protein